MLCPQWILRCLLSQNRRTNQCCVFVFVAIAKVKVSWGSIKACFLLKKKLHKTKKKRPLRFNYTSPLLLTRKKCTLAMSFHNQDTCTCCFLLANSYFLLLPMLSRVSLLGTGMQPQWWSLEKKIIWFSLSLYVSWYACAWCLIFILFFTGPGLIYRIFFFWCLSAPLHQLFLSVSNKFFFPTCMPSCLLIFS